MANSTDPFAESVHGTNPQYLVEKITRLKIYNCRYWKESCFGLTSETIVDKAISLKYCGGTYGGSNKPSDFICLVLKLLQLQPELDIAIEFIRNQDFKYLRVLGAFYIRLVAKPEEIFRYLEPLYEDFRKIAYRGMAGWSCKYMDEFIDSLLVEELVCDIALPHLPKRMKLEQLGILQERTSILDSELFNDDDKEPAADAAVNSTKLLKSTVPDSVAPKETEEKRKIFGDVSNGNEEYINEYRKDDVRSRRAALQDEDVDQKKRKSDRPERRRESSSDRKEDHRNQSRELDKYETESKRYSGRGRDKDRGDDVQKRELRSTSRSPEAARVVRRRDSSRSRDSEGREDRHRESRRHSTRDRERSRSYDRRRRSRSRSTGRSRKSNYYRNDRNKGGSSRYRSKDRKYDREDDRRSRRVRDRSDSNDDRKDRKSRGSRYRSRSRSHSEGRRRSRADSRDRSHKRSRRSPSSSTSSSNSGSSSSSSESEKETVKLSAPTSSSRNQEKQEDSDAEDSKVTSSAVDDKAAAAKAAKAEKKFDKMFKTKKSDNGDAKAPSGDVVRAHPEGSVEYWNQIREGLGIKKLKS